MKRFGTVVLMLAGFVGGIVFVYSCGGGSNSQGGGLTWPSPVAVTGQTTSYATGDDGDLKAGVVWPIPRFTDNADGTVTDNLTGLVWLKNANCYGARNWSTALTDVSSLNSGICGLSDGSTAGDWRLPSVKELLSLLDYSRYAPALPSGHPFTGVQSDEYYTSTTVAPDTAWAWLVDLYSGDTDTWVKSDGYYVWPIRDST